VPTHLGLARRRAAGRRTFGHSAGDGGKIGDAGRESVDSSSSESPDEVQKDEVDPFLLMSSSSASVRSPYDKASLGPPRASPLVSSMALLLRPEPTIVQKVRIIEYGCQKTRPW